MSEIKIIEGEISNDFRSETSSLNSFRFDKIKRMYTICHPDKSIIRGWHGHQFEKKMFYFVKGIFKSTFVKLDGWNNPSNDLQPELFSLSDRHSAIICLPCGYANCIKAMVTDSILLVYSDKLLEEALLDSCRYDASLWVDWSKE